MKSASKILPDEPKKRGILINISAIFNYFKKKKKEKKK